MNKLNQNQSERYQEILDFLKRTNHPSAEPFAECLKLSDSSDPEIRELMKMTLELVADSTRLTGF